MHGMAREAVSGCTRLTRERLVSDAPSPVVPYLPVGECLAFTGGNSARVPTSDTVGVDMIPGNGPGSEQRPEWLPDRLHGCH
jgi:hypothetical protein